MALTFSHSSCNNPIVHYKGNIFTIHRKNLKSTVFRCKNYRRPTACKARITTMGNEIVGTPFLNHNHTPNMTSSPDGKMAPHNIGIMPTDLEFRKACANLGLYLIPQNSPQSMKLKNENGDENNLITDEVFRNICTRLGLYTKENPQNSPQAESRSNEISEEEEEDSSPDCDEYFTEKTSKRWSKSRRKTTKPKMKWLEYQ